MLTLVNGYTRRHAVRINWFSSLLGAMGLGYLLLHKLNCALLLSLALVYSMACTKVYLFRVIDGRPVIPRGKSPAYMVAWWICFGLLAAFFILCGIALWVAVFAGAFNR